MTKNGPVYVGGLDRSGKTTMRDFLVSHPHIAIPSVGSNMWTYFYGQYGDLSKPKNFERCLNDLLRYKHVRFLKPDPDRIRDEFWQGPPTYARLFALFLIHFAEREGKPRWGAQTGLIERYAPQLFRAYPGLKIIHMVRDPRDRYEASLALWPKGKGRAGGATARWLYSTRLAERNQQRYPDQYKIVRFETLITQTEETLCDICAFLDEPYVPEMLAMKGAPKHRDQLTNGREIEPGQSPLSPAFIGRFREKVSKEEIAFIQLHAGRKMQAYNYPLEPIGNSLRDWLKFALADWPNQFARMAAWITLEKAQHNLPALIGRQPGQRMIIDAPLPPSSQLETN